MLKLTREIRFALEPEDNSPLPNSANGFAANPALTSIAPFLTLAATLSGQIDPATGMLINIKIVDKLLRIYAIAFIREKLFPQRPAQKNLGLTPPVNELRGRPFGRILIKLGILPREEIHHTLAMQADEKKSSGRHRPIGELLIFRGLITPAQRDLVLQLQKGIVPSDWPTSSNQPALLLPELFELLSREFDPHTLESLTLHLSPYLSFATHKENPAMVHLSLRFEFSAAHRLHSDTLSEKENTDIFGRCNNPNGHGHNYELEVTLAGEPNPTTGHLLPIPAFQKIVNETILDRFDHKHLNLDLPDFKSLNPTVENIAAVIFKKLKPAIPAPASLHHIRIWETPKTFAEYSE